MQLDSDQLSLSPPSLDSSWRASSSPVEEETLSICQERELPPNLTAAQQKAPARTRPDSKAWLNKLQYFRRTGVHHLFFQDLTPNRETQVNEQKPEPIPSSKMSMVHTTIEENFLEGTLHFLSEFVSCKHCPSKDIVSYLVRGILLNSHRGEILKDTYMLLMKIQMYVFPLLLHPASTGTVGWDWTLLKYTMEDEEKPPGRLLFLEYVVQTLEDDLQQNLRLHLLQKSIAKKVLSCDMCFSNVKDVVEWLVAAVTGVGFCQPQEQPRGTTNSSAEALSVSPRVMLLLQRMLSIAVEVDRSPNCSSCKIADVIFPYILNIPLRSQREAFLNTMDSQLLRCKVLELMFQHSCEVPTNMPLSLAKILYFLSHSVLLQYQGSTAWDTLLPVPEQVTHTLPFAHCLLPPMFSLAGHLRSALSERMDLIIKKAKPKLQDDDHITQLDIHLNMENFLSRLQQVLGEEPFPLQIKEKVQMLQELLLIVTPAPGRQSASNTDETKDPI
uniref:SUMO interacting motifs containing 1 n=1 Tax=Nothoprocta perdicaria TaxID=30464 RepID=A0A8C7EAS4_NOTPE